MESAKHPVFDGIKKELAEAKNRIKELEKSLEITQRAKSSLERQLQGIARNIINQFPMVDFGNNLLRGE